MCAMTGDGGCGSRQRGGGDSGADGVFGGGGGLRRGENKMCVSVDENGGGLGGQKGKSPCRERDLEASPEETRKLWRFL
ncbi:hypothetical protein Droror1_Dr00019680 [Drosera rotundifolia]